MLENYVQKLWTELDLDGTPHREAGAFRVVLDEDVLIAIREAPEQGHYLEGQVCQIPEGDSSAIFAALMQANLFMEGTNGGGLGIDEDGQNLLLWKILSPNLNFSDFFDGVEDHYNWLRYWRDQIPELNKDQVAKPFM